MEQIAGYLEQIAGYLEQKRRQSERKSCLLERAWNGPSPALGGRGTGRPPGGGVAGNEGAPPQGAPAAAAAPRTEAPASRPHHGQGERVHMGARVSVGRTFMSGGTPAVPWG
jgi:hypothetical protein